MSKSVISVVAAVVSIAAAGCSQSTQSPTSASSMLVSANAGPQTSSGLGTVKETLSGAAIGGVVPEGQALADESQYLNGGSTTLTVQVKKVNLPSGTVLNVTLDFTPIGTITLSNQEGTLRAQLGHFAVSRDQVRVNNGSTTILSGGFFQ